MGPTLELDLLEDPHAIPGVALEREAERRDGLWTSFDAVHSDDQKPLRATIVASSLAHADGYAPRFERDAARLPGLRHPALVVTHAGGRCDRGLFLVTDPPPPLALTQLADAADPAAILTQLAPVADALDTLHGAGMVHGAVCPGLLRADDTGRVRLAAVGLADHHVAHADLGPDWPPCVAPELLEGEAPTPASDVFGFAATLWRCLTGGWERHPRSVGPATLAALKRGLTATPSLRPDGAHAFLDRVLHATYSER